MPITAKALTARAFAPGALFIGDEAGRIDMTDPENPILRGVRIMEVGKLAVFKAVLPDGKEEVRHVKIETAHVDALLSHADSIEPSHWTHDYHGRIDPLAAQIGGIVNVRRENGMAVGDMKLAPTSHRDQILWNAANMPGRMMLSPVFNFEPSDPKCIPTSFDAADLVETGAGTTALFADESTTSNSMTPEEFCTQLDDPKVKAMIEGMIKGHTKAEGEMDDEAAGEMESASGVSDEDKKDEEKHTPALMAAVAAKVPGARMRLAQVRCARATARLSKAKTVGMNREEVNTLIEAASTRALGANKALLATIPGYVADDSPATAFMGRLSTQLKAGAKPAIAIMRAKADAKPGEYNAWFTAGQKLPKITE